MAKTSAGLLPYRKNAGAIEVFLVHPGGPFWARKNEGAWSIAKGECNEGEDPLAAARREFTEETSFSAGDAMIELGSLKQPSGKVVHAWAFEGDFDAAAIRSNTFSIEWPPRSGRLQEFPEVDRAAWFGLEEAGHMMLKGQIPFLDRLRSAIGLGEEAAREGPR